MPNTHSKVIPILHILKGKKWENTFQLVLGGQYCLDAKTRQGVGDRKKAMKEKENCIPISLMTLDVKQNRTKQTKHPQQNISNSTLTGNERNNES